MCVAGGGRGHVFILFLHCHSLFPWSSFSSLYYLCCPFSLSPMPVSEAQSDAGPTGAVGCGKGVVSYVTRMAYIWVRTAILVAGNGRRGIFFISSVSSLAFLNLFLPRPSL